MGDARLPIIASRESYDGEQMLVHQIETRENGTFLYMTVGDTKTWYMVTYRIVPDGTYNQSVQNIQLPYIVVGNNVYSIDSFYEWEHNR